MLELVMACLREVVVLEVLRLEALMEVCFVENQELVGLEPWGYLASAKSPRPWMQQFEFLRD